MRDAIFGRVLRADRPTPDGGDPVRAAALRPRAQIT
jgi:hypothetical protein